MTFALVVVVKNIKIAVVKKHKFFVYWYVRGEKLSSQKYK
jgi:hypothetical protein